MTFPAQQYAQQPLQQPAPQAFAPAQPQQQAPAQFGQQPAAPQQQWAPQPGAESMPDEDTSGLFGGPASISWDNKKGYVNGTPRGGLIIAKRTSQQTDWQTKQPKFFDAEKRQPMTQIEVTVQTRERTDANDDGKRTIYVKGQMVKAAAEAFRALGARDLEIGAYFYAAKVAQDAGRNGKGNRFQCLYARPGSPDPLANMPAYVAPTPPPQQQAPEPAFVPPVQPSYPQPGAQPQWAGQPGQQAVAATGMDPQYATPAMQQAAWQAQQQPAAAPQFAPQQPTQGYADPSQGQQQYAPQAPAQPQQWAQQPAAPAQGGGAPADYNPFAQQ